MIVQAVVATDLAGVIGVDGKLPWDVPEDLAWFKKWTLGGPIIMGPKTFASLPGLLPARQHVVVSSKFKRGMCESLESAQIWHCDSLDFILGFSRSFNEKQVSIIGGEELFKSALPHLDRAIITTIHTVVDATDAETVRYFPFDNLFERQGVLHKNYPIHKSSSGLKYSTAIWEKT